jgi:hypothetical protein
MKATVCIVVLSIALPQLILNPSPEEPANVPLDAPGPARALNSELTEPLNRSVNPTPLPMSGLEHAPVPVGSSSGQALQSNTEPTPSSSSCEASGGDIPAELHSQSELAALITQYMLRSPDRLFSALDEIYVHEERDEAWASKLEEKVSLAVHQAHLQAKGDCRSSLCRFNFESPSAEGCSHLGIEFNGPIINSTMNTEFEVNMVQRATPNGCTKYIYSMVVPPAFLEPLRRKMN